MLVALPWQRKEGMVDGPGLVLFTLGWVALSPMLCKLNLSSDIPKT